MAHQSVLVNEVLTLLDPRPGQVVVDATVGIGGHARALAEKLDAAGKLIGIDRDPEMLAIAERELAGLPVVLVHGNFENLPEILEQLQPEILEQLQQDKVDAVLADLGFCSDQLADPRRGLSFQQEGPLDMRLDPTRGDTAGDLLRRLREEDLADVFWRYGEERFSRRIARKIVETRKAAPLTTTTQLADLVRSCVPRQHGKGRMIDPATRVFQALRIAVNDELGALERLLQVLPDCLKPGGKAAIISFHSLEDRLVKRAFRGGHAPCAAPGTVADSSLSDGTRSVPTTFEEITRKPWVATEEEVRHNPRARSAKLRVARLRSAAESGPDQ